ncbi:MAG: glycosyltransferase [Actinomycetota bacterium]|nr:glycosyltransferase [Actinomycetota bacterium]
MSPAEDRSGPTTPEVRETPVSVCLASYDGATWIEEMLASILVQLGPDDEVVVVDDGSSDDTVALVAALGDPRIRLHRNDENLGSVRTFERAMRLSRGRVVLLADQDDVWVPGRLDAMVGALRDHGVVATSVAVLGEPLDPPRWPLRARDSSRRLLNLGLVLVGTRWYFGCAMGLRRDVLDVALPIPAFVHESHDLWLGVVGNVLGEMTHLERPSVQRRLHDANQTPLHWRSLPTILASRWMLARALGVAVRRARRWGSPPSAQARGRQRNE